MSIDKSLKKRGALIRARNVLKRDERIEKLLEQDRWQEGDRPYGLPKVRIQRVVARKAKKKAKEEEAETTEEEQAGEAETETK